MQPIFQEHICLTQEELDAYVQGKLADDQRHRVENHLLDCPLCSDAVEGSRLLHTQAPQKVKALNPNYLRWLRAAAAILIVAACLVSLRFFLNQGNSDLYSAYYTTYPNELANLTRSTDAPSNEGSETDHLQDALRAYDAGNFEQSLIHFEAELARNTENPIAEFYGGIAALETGDTPKATELLRSAARADSIYETEAKWYLALALLREGKQQAAAEILDAFIANPGSRYYEKAKELRSKF